MIVERTGMSTNKQSMMRFCNDRIIQHGNLTKDIEEFLEFFF